MRLLFLLLLPLLARAAAPPAHPYADAVRRRIATAQDERNTAALLPFLRDKNATYRAAAALAFGSVQDKTAVPALLPLLGDKVPAVRRAAAFALGQTGDSTAVAALGSRLGSTEPNYAARRAAYEAYGRCATRRTVATLWQTPAPDTSSALAWGLYRASLRGLATAEAIGRAAGLLDADGASVATRRGAAAALTRARGQDSVLAQVARPVLLRHLAGDSDYYVRVCCATALGRVAQPAATAALLQAVAADQDFWVRIAALRALPSRFYYPPNAGATSGNAANWGAPAVGYKDVARSCEHALRQPLAQEAGTAAEWFLRTAPDTANPLLAEYIATSLLQHASSTPHFRARATLLQAALRYAPRFRRAGIADTIRHRYERSDNAYECAALLAALSEDPAQFNFLDGVTRQMPVAAGLFHNPALLLPPVVSGAALAALVALRENKQFPAARQADFTTALRRALTGGDVGQLSTAAEAYANPALVPAATPDDLAALRAAQAKLTLPQDIEAWIGLRAALDKLTHAPQPTPAPKGAAGQHPIDWALVQQIPVGQRVRITTTKGAVELELKVAEAPGSVASFVQLVRQHFYDGLYFHRVVPDFVAQGGDPRGDGSGSTPYTLRSEFSELTYGAGAVGLASAGKDTESCQFFFTHLPTPHLDGRYTIFAQVVSGLDVVQQLEVGDRMLRVELR